MLRLLPRQSPTGRQPGKRHQLPSHLNPHLHSSLFTLLPPHSRPLSLITLLCQIPSGTLYLVIPSLLQPLEPQLEAPGPPLRSVAAVHCLHRIPPQGWPLARVISCLDSSPPQPLTNLLQSTRQSLIRDYQLYLSYHRYGYHASSDS